MRKDDTGIYPSRRKGANFLRAPCHQGACNYIYRRKLRLPLGLGQTCRRRCDDCLDEDRTLISFPKFIRSRRLQSAGRPSSRNFHLFLSHKHEIPRHISVTRAASSGCNRTYWLCGRPPLPFVNIKPVILISPVICSKRRP
jgi:hypothetical protein